MRIVDDEGRQYRSKVEAACNGSPDSSYFIEELYMGGARRDDITAEIARFREQYTSRLRPDHAVLGRCRYNCGCDGRDSLSEIPKGNDVVLPPCPQCGGVLRLEFKFKVKVVSLAGTQMKLGATPWPFLVCDCGFTEEGKVE